MARKEAFLQRFINRWVWQWESRQFIQTEGLAIDANVISQILGIDKDSEVTKATSLAIPALYRGLRVRSDTIGSLQLNVIRKTDTGSEVLTNHPVQKLLKTPNDLMTSYVFRQLGQGGIDLEGNFLAEIERDSMNRPVALWPLPIDKVTPKTDDLGRELVYKFKDHPKLETRTIDQGDMIHVKNFGLNGIIGLGLIEVAANTLNYGLKLNALAQNYIQNNAIPSGLLTFEGGRLTSDQKKDSKESWQKANSNGKVAVLDGPWKFSPLSIPPEQMQFLESRKFAVADIARFIGVEPNLLFDDTRLASYSSVEQQNLNFVQYTIRSIVKNWEEELEKKLLTEKEKAEGEISIRFNLNSLLRGDTQTRAQFYQTLHNIGAINSNTIAEFEDLPKPKGGEKYWMQLGFGEADKDRENEQGNKESNRKGRDKKTR